ncbi:MAG TPA: hypothetical protein PKL88_03255, partial [bacterium]|nr:hypothetical protein [bacterium]
MTIYHQKEIVDIDGETIDEGDIIETTISSEWDSEVPRAETAVVEYDGGIWWAKSEITSDWYDLSEREYKWAKIK